MDTKNRFDLSFEEMTRACFSAENTRSNLVKETLNLNSIKKNILEKQVELRQRKEETAKLKDENKELRVSLLQALIERDELADRRTALTSQVEAIRLQM